MPGSLPVPVTFNFHLTKNEKKSKKKKKKAAGESTRYENDELVIKTQDLSLDRNVLERSHERRKGKKVVSVKLRLISQPEVWKGSRQQWMTSRSHGSSDNKRFSICVGKSVELKMKRQQKL